MSTNVRHAAHNKAKNPLEGFALSKPQLARMHGINHVYLQKGNLLDSERLTS